MAALHRCRLHLWAVLFLAGLLLAVTPAPVRAQYPWCAPNTFTLDFPKSGALLSGRVMVEFSMGPPMPGERWQYLEVWILDSAGNLVHHPPATLMHNQAGVYAWDTYTLPDGTYQISVGGGQSNLCTYQSSWVTVTIQNPDYCRQAPMESIHCACKCDQQATRSTTSPRTGNQQFDVPIASWEYHGATYDLTLNYSSFGLRDPSGPHAPYFAGLDEWSPKWRHNYAQWIDLYRDEVGGEWAVWHHDTGHTAFGKSGTAFVSDDSTRRLSWGGGPVTSPTFWSRGSQVTLQVPYGWFILRQSDGTELHFNYQPPSGQSHLFWGTGESRAVPHYLLSRIVDRWGRVLNVSWSAGGEPRVTAVTDGGGTGVTLSYTNGMLTAVGDPQGRTHQLSYTSVPDEDGRGRQKLTGVTVYGAGSPYRATYNWSFVYRDPNNPSNGYLGTYTGDLIIQKTEPDGTTTGYIYEPVGLGWYGFRPRPRDWEGRIWRMWWTDASEGSTVTKVIERNWHAADTLQLIQPGGATTRYTYSGHQLSAITDAATGRKWSFTYDGRDNLETLRTPKEQTTPNPLVEHAYTYDANGWVDHLLTRTRRDDGTLGDPVETWFNDLGLPTQVKAHARAGSGHADQLTQLEYDAGGPLTAGNLTRIVTAVGTALQQEARLFYDAPDGAWGLPTRFRDPLGAESATDYENTRGWPLSTTSPENLVVPTGHVDRSPSVTVLSYNADGLPYQVTDAEGHTETLTYSAAAAGSPNLVVTVTHADNSSRSVTLDAAGRPLAARDENNVRTEWTYNPQGQVKTVRRAVGTAQEALTVFYYDLNGDLMAFDPPKGSAGRVYLEYSRYTQSGTLEGTYKGQLTRIRYPDGTSEYFGYDAAGELEWWRRRDGGIGTLERDSLHRVTAVHYPATPVYSGFSVTYAHDEFGRLTSTTDLAGTTSLAYDDLGRVTSVTPSAPQKALTYAYTPDLALKRWTTTVTLAGVGSYQYREDTKGRLSELENPFGQVFRTEYDRDGKNLVTFFPNGTREETSYTGRDWLAGRLLRRADGTVQDTLEYFYTDANGVYDPTGHLRREVDAGGRTHAFAYDALYRLTQETHPDFGSLGYAYDLNGNRTARTTANGTDYYGYDAADRLLWSNRAGNAAPTSGQALPYQLWSYDSAGRVTRRERRLDPPLDAVGVQVHEFGWDGDDRLRAITDGGVNVFNAVYDGDGLRVSKSDSFTGVHNYSRGPGGVLHDSAGSTVYTPGAAYRSSGTDRFVHGDWRGSTRYLSDSTGNGMANAFRYDGYGRQTVQSGGWSPDAHLFAGQYGYETEWRGNADPGIGLQYLEQRYYDPEMGRFLSPDPIGYMGGLNLYPYVAGDPVNTVDPSGTRFVIIGEPSYVSGVRKTLDSIRNRGPNGRALVSILEGSPHVFRIQREGARGPAAKSEDPSRSDIRYKGIWPFGEDVRNVGCGGTIFFNPHDGPISAERLPTADNSPTPRVVILGHELAHAWRFMRGISGLRNEEVQTSVLENYIRKDFGLARRTEYIGAGRVPPPAKLDYGVPFW